MRGEVTIMRLLRSKASEDSTRSANGFVVLTYGCDNLR